MDGREEESMRERDEKKGKGRKLKREREGNSEERRKKIEERSRVSDREEGDLDEAVHSVPTTSPFFPHNRYRTHSLKRTQKSMAMVDLNVHSALR
jgi:hypothetical protein